MRDVFGVGGLLKAEGTTTVFVTHASMYLSIDHKDSSDQSLEYLLAHADHIVALDSTGQIVKHGPPDMFGENEETQPELSNVDHMKRYTEVREEEAEGHISIPLQQTSPALQNSVDSETQRLGDGSVYKYYFSTFGWPKTIVFFALQATLVFCLKFPGKQILLE